jgi:hypothetical protein
MNVYSVGPALRAPRTVIGAQTRVEEREASLSGDIRFAAEQSPASRGWGKRLLPLALLSAFLGFMGGNQAPKVNWKQADRETAEKVQLVKETQETLALQTEENAYMTFKSLSALDRSDLPPGMKLINILPVLEGPYAMTLPEKSDMKTPLVFIQAKDIAGRIQREGKIPKAAQEALVVIMANLPEFERKPHPDAPDKLLLKSTPVPIDYHRAKKALIKSITNDSVEE